MHSPNRVPASLRFMPAKLASMKVAIESSPLLPGMRPIELRYQDGGRGAPMVLLHGGWGYGFYSHEDAIAKLDRRFIIPDRPGDGGSPQIPQLPPQVHRARPSQTERPLGTRRIRRPLRSGRRRRG